MPVYLITLHTYGRWLPDRGPGYVRRDRDGVQARDAGMANSYRTQMGGDAVLLTDEQRRVVIEVLRDTAKKTELRLYAVAVETTHVHILVGWRDASEWSAVRGSIKRSMTLGLNKRFGPKTWWARGGSRRRVRNRSHFDELAERYLPGHSLCWREGDP
ncbi:MAG: transposase [Planctomycetota bacterium]